MLNMPRCLDDGIKLRSVADKTIGQYICIRAQLCYTSGPLYLNIAKAYKQNRKTQHRRNSIYITIYSV